MKPYFDVAIVVPLDEEFETAQKHFNFVADQSTSQRIRFEVSVPNSEAKILLVKQNTMGRTDCTSATMDIVEEFDVGLLVCLGIAGGLSNDLAIGDVCRTGEVVDILDNAKVTDLPGSGSERRTAKARGRSGSSPKKGGHETAFSATHYETPIEVSVALELDKLIPERRAAFEEWAADRAGTQRDLPMCRQSLSIFGRRPTEGLDPSLISLLVCALFAKPNHLIPSSSFRASPNNA